MSFATLLRRDVPASLVVFLVAVPLSLGIALASGAPIVAGLIAAVVGGIVAGLFGGSAMQVSGPAAGLTVVVAETIARFGWAATCAMVVAAGALQIVLGLSRIARGALAISPAIVHGMLGGIGLTIVLGQLHVVLGGSAQSSALDNLLDLPGQLVGSHDTAAFIGVLTIGILLLWPRLPQAVRKVPGPLAAIAFTTVLALVAGLQLDRIELPGNLLELSFAPRLPEGGWFDIGVAVLTIALIASVESLLSAIAVDKLHTGPRANLNRELVGQGMANMASGALGGLPVTGVIVRSSTNVAAGARTRASAVLHGIWVLLFSVLLAGLLESIPLAALGGLLVHVGAKLLDVGNIRQVHRHGDLPIYLVTLLGVVFVDMLSGVLLGIATSLVLMLLRTRSKIHAEADGDRWRVVVDGALTFLAIPKLSKVLAAIPERAEVTVELVVDYLDHAAFENLSSWQQAHERTGGTVVVDEVGHPYYQRGKSGAPTVSRLAAAPVVPRWLASWSDWQAKSGPHLPDQRSVPPSTAQLALGTSEFQRRTAPLVQGTLSGLADGQNPHTLFITCADSRIVPNLITTSGPGDLFAVRNIGNLVPADSGVTGDTGPPLDTSVGASIEYAVGVLRVPEVVVCGHSGCGAMKLMLDPTAELPAVREWLRHAEPSLRRYEKNSPVSLDGELPAAEGDRLALHNVLQQLRHLRRYPVVAEAEARGELHLTGMYFDVGAAQVYLFDPESGTFEPAGERAACTRD
ncbi:SulP family inorganic anion transporter [Amycolatopsis lurida]